MKFLVISDLHGNLSMLEKLSAEFEKADAVLCAGDFSEFDHLETGLPMLEALCKKHDVIFAVTGNCDEPAFRLELEAKDISCEAALAWHEGLAFCGSGGGSKFSGATPNERTDDELASDLNIVFAQTENCDAEKSDTAWNNLIVIMHNPPKDTECDKISSGLHVGSASLRKFIEKTSPLLVVTGHIHESAGIDKIGNTVVINPGSLSDGFYGVVEVSKDAEFFVSRCELCSVK